MKHVSLYGTSTGCVGTLHSVRHEQYVTQVPFLTSSNNIRRPSRIRGLGQRRAYLCLVTLVSNAGEHSAEVIGKTAAAGVESRYRLSPGPCHAACAVLTLRNANSGAMIPCLKSMHLGGKARNRLSTRLRMAPSVTAEKVASASVRGMDGRCRTEDSFQSSRMGIWSGLGRPRSTAKC